MIPTMLDILCNRAPYCNKKDYVAKVPAEVIATFNSTTQAVHEQMRPRLAVLWKAWAAKNHESLRMTAAAAIIDAPAASADANEELADLLATYSAKFITKQD